MADPVHRAKDECGEYRCKRCSGDDEQCADCHNRQDVDYFETLEAEQ